MPTRRKILCIPILLAIASASIAEPPASNNPLQLGGENFYGADPSVVIADDGRLFLFPTTDNRDWEKQFGWSCYSTDDLVNWTDHGVIFSNEDSAWGTHKAWAPDITKRDGKYYFFYYFNNGGAKVKGVGVAVADKPEGPYTELTPEPLVRGHDPAVFADDDGRYWLYLQDRVAELGDDMKSLKKPMQNLNLEYRPEKFEAAYVFKREDIYYFTIARGWNNLIYYTGKSPTGPFEFRGEFFKPYGGNNHHSILKYKGEWIILYHEWVKDDPVHQRQIRAEYLHFNDDGTIRMVEPTEEGVSFINDTAPAKNDAAAAIKAHNRPVHLLPDEWMRDPFIHLHKDGWYYLTGTRLDHTEGGVQGIQIWRSRDLVDWKPVGVPWTFDGSSWIREVPPRPGDTRPNQFLLWAPELHFANDRWVAMHTTNRRRANLLVSDGQGIAGPFTEPMGPNFGHRHDPSLFIDDDGTQWLVWACTRIAKLKDDFSGFDGDEISIGPSDRKMGHEGAYIVKIGEKYILFGTAWSMDSLRQGTYNMYYCTADKITGLYSERRFAGRFCGHGTPFQDKDGRWWTTAFLNGEYEPDPNKGQNIVDEKRAWTANPRGLTLVPLDVKIANDGDVFIRAKSDLYANPGPEEVQKFSLKGGEPRKLATAKKKQIQTPDKHTPLSTAEKKSLVKSHDEAFETLDEKVRDPFIHRGPDGKFYLTGTTAGSHWGDTIGIRVWRSNDLAEWEDLGFVWDLHQDGKAQPSWHHDREPKPGIKNGLAVWAPEIHYLNGTWWIPHSLNVSGHGLLKSTSGEVEGPYTALPPVAAKGGIDAHLFQEGDRTWYLWGADNLLPVDQKFQPTATKPLKIKPTGKHALGYEGILLHKLGEKYLLIASGRYGYETTDSYDLYYCVGNSLEGSYGERRMAVKNAGHGNLFQDNQGRWWCTAFDHEFITSPNRWTVWLIPVEIEDTGDDLLIHVKDERFRPTSLDRKEVATFSKNGPPPGREGKKPWDR
ncbi:MAG: family 43 glycosylhydrolase [Verrucomicrobiota bacterium]